MRTLNNLAADLHFALRMFRKNLGFSLVCILSMALGIGASSAIFSMVYALLYDPYPYKDSDRIINISFGGPSIFSLKDEPGGGSEATAMRSPF